MKSSQKPKNQFWNIKRIITIGVLVLSLLFILSPSLESAQNPKESQKKQENGAGTQVNSGVSNGAEEGITSWQPFGFLTDNTMIDSLEKVGLIATLLISIAALIYAYILGKQIVAADKGTQTMREIAGAIRAGADAYLRRQFTTVGIVLIFLLAIIILTKWPWNSEGMSQTQQNELQFLAISRGVAFFVGSIFSASVGFFGMRLATTGNLRVAAAARHDYLLSMKLAYQTGTVTGLLTTGLGLFGGSMIVVIVGEKAYETLLGFAFGGSLLALFMRVGGGIYTKAADVGADLVGKIEANIPEDDPRNAATIADNVGDNVGDCAGMAADVFESYSVTMVAAMILGYASLGPKAMLLPLLIQAVGILSSLFSTRLVGHGLTEMNARGVMHRINRSFRFGAILSIIGILAVSLIYLHFDAPYIVRQALERNLTKYGNVAEVLQKELALRNGKENLADIMKEGPHFAQYFAKLPETEQIELTQIKVKVPPTEQIDEPFGEPKLQELTLIEAAQQVVPIRVGLDMRPAWTCLIGIFLTLALIACTEYWTSTGYHPVRSLALSSRTGHATNIIQGIALGYESTVWSAILIAIAIFLGVFIYQDTENPILIAFGISLCGIGMLTLTCDTLSMDVFGPVADNANGIGEMGYNRDGQNRPLTSDHPEYLTAEQYHRARQTLNDLDATGNTTKATTKGIAIGSAVIAAVSLFASFTAVLVKGNEESINQLTPFEFESKMRLLSVAKPHVFIGMLIGGVVPFLFSSMTIRAVGRAAFLIVNECRRQFRDPQIFSGTKRPDYGRVVAICTSTAQRELIGPGLIAICTPILVGFLLGPFALGGFLAGMIIVGQLLAVFMATAGGAWDNAKKLIEDQPRTELTGKGSEMHKASITGDTVGDPLKDTAGPAINPLIKVMNLVSLLVLPLAILYNIHEHHWNLIGIVVIVVSIFGVIGAWWESNRESPEFRQLDDEFNKEIEAAQEQAEKEATKEAALVQ